MPRPVPASPPAGKAAGTALLVIDMISGWDFPDAEKLLPSARRITTQIAALQCRCRRTGIPVIYANDNRGMWRSDFSRLVAQSLACGGPAAEITRALLPAQDDYFVLKPKHSVFFGTPMELLLQHLGVRRIVLTGVSSDQCVMVSASEARMRDLEVVVPRDCVASQTRQRNEAALRQLEESHKVATTPGSRVRLMRQAGHKASTLTTTQEPR